MKLIHFIMDAFLANPTSFAASVASANLSIKRHVVSQVREYTTHPQNYTYSLDKNAVFVYAMVTIVYGIATEFIQLIPEKFQTIMNTPPYTFSITWNFAANTIVANTQICGPTGTSAQTVLDYVVFTRNG